MDDKSAETDWNFAEVDCRVNASAADGILHHIPQALVFDSYGSSEAGSLGASVSSATATEQTARFAIGPRSAIFTEDGRRVEPGSGEKGLVSVGGFIPLGYHKDEAKTAATFPTFEGRRWSVPGDLGTSGAYCPRHHHLSEVERVDGSPDNCDAEGPALAGTASAGSGHRGVRSGRLSTC
jgi:hypothetical protein